MSEDNETRFPHLNPNIREDYPITTDAVDDWFNRCMTDIPVVPVRTLDHKKEYWRLSDWLMRWFEQFMEDKQDA